MQDRAADYCGERNSVPVFSFSRPWLIDTMAESAAGHVDRPTCQRRTDEHCPKIKAHGLIILSDRLSIS
jgi:hypothetical protein